ncbi:MAG: nucleotide exchange factor GrpE [Sphingomonas oligoaromativorans]|uniref:nucleotide exchange factor GrpE n=1 Tax=Sphingomonas oligoaromativorans TaxID=575322 RepID=UPI00142207E8|nr:nucleotide exchange factor GrpE [Sphingomonas oligoaromativorans]NIJ32606.1 molecular chaperone GrpE [Sphingomonas oligoaromativorans]
MTDENKMNETDDTLRAETAAVAPELAEHDALKAELEETRNQVLYVQAEMQNLRRRTEREMADAKAYATTGFARDLLSVADNLVRALAAIPSDLRADEKLKPLVTGIEMTGKELETVFQRNGITRIEAIGQALDPNKHQAIMEMESADAAPGTVIHEMQSGWMIKDRLLRPAMVGVAKAPEGVGIDIKA